jgi:hypothetical protein
MRALPVARFEKLRCAHEVHAFCLSVLHGREQGTYRLRTR